MTARKLTRRRLIAAGTATAVGALVHPAILKAQSAFRRTAALSRNGDAMAKSCSIAHRIEN